MAEKKKVNAKREAEEVSPMLRAPRTKRFADIARFSQAKANEAIRRKGGKDQSAIKAELALKEAVRLVC